MSPTSPIAELSDEHVTLVADAKDIEESVNALGAGTGAAWSGIGGALAERVEMFRTDLLLHCRREEVGLYPDAKRMLGERSQGPDIMVRFFAEESEEDLSAHAVLASRTEDTLSLLEHIEQQGKLDEQALGRLRTLVSVTRSLLERHASKEDTLIFPMIERSLDPMQLEDIRKRMSGLGAPADLTMPSAEDF